MSPMKPRPAAAHLMLAAAVAVWGTSYPVTRYALRFVPPYTLAFLRYALAALFFAVFMRGRLRIPAREAGTVLLLGLTGGLGFAALMNLGMGRTTGVSGSLLSGAPPLITALLAAAILKEPLRAWKLAGLSAGIAGIICITVSSFLAGGDGTGAFKGDLLVFASQVCWAVYTVTGKRAAGRMGGAVAGAWGVIAAAGMLFPPALAEAALGRPCAAGAGAVGSLLYLSIFNTALAYILWNKALDTVDASTAAGFQFIQPLSGAIASMAMLGEGLTPAIAAGAALVIAGVSMMARAGGRPPINAPPPA